MLKWVVVVSQSANWRWTGLYGERMRLSGSILVVVELQIWDFSSQVLSMNHDFKVSHVVRKSNSSPHSPLCLCRWCVK